MIGAKKDPLKPIICMRETTNPASTGESPLEIIISGSQEIKVKNNKDCTPIKKLIFHANLDFHTFTLIWSLLLFLLTGWFFTCGTQTKIPIISSPIQENNEPLHPKSRSKAKGAEIPEAMAANMVIPVVYTAVTNPILAGNLFLIKGMSKTLQITIPIPVKPVPRNNSNEPPKILTIVPTASRIRANKIALELPNLLPREAEKIEKVAKVKRGSVVRNPAQPLVSPRSSLINGIKGPTAVMEGRKLKATNNIPNIRNQDFW